MFLLMYAATLPALFFAAVTSQNDQDGTVIYGNDVYLRENRKTAKLKFPFEASSKMCQVKNVVSETIGWN